MVWDKEVAVIVLKQICPRLVRWEATDPSLEPHSGDRRAHSRMATGAMGDDAALLLSKISASCVGENIQPHGWIEFHYFLTSSGPDRVCAPWLSAEGSISAERI